MILWRITPLIQIFPKFEPQSVFQSYFTFSQVFSSLQWTSTLLFKEKIELSKFRQNLTYVYRYKWWFVSIQTLWPAFKLKDLTYVSIQHVCVSIHISVSWNLDWYVSNHASMIRYIMHHLVFWEIQVCIDTCKHDSIHRWLSASERPLLYRYKWYIYRYKMLKISLK